MKKAQVVLHKFVAGFALFVITFWGCKEDLNKTGYDLLLPGDLISARKDLVDKATIKSYTVTDELLRTNKPKNSLLGTFNDPIFGKTTTDFACQFRLAKTPDLSNAKFDKLILTLLYYETYGDRVTPQNLKVYELNSPLNGEDTLTYYQDIDLKSYANSEVLGENMYVPKFELDSLRNKYGSTKLNPKDTVVQQIKFSLSESFAKKLMAFKVPKEETSPNDRFLEYFKGLYIESGDLNQGGGIMRLIPNGEVISLVANVRKLIPINTEMKLYYHINDTIQDSLIYSINSRSARTSQFVHNYSTASFNPYPASFNPNPDSNLDPQDTLIYLQTTGGLSNKIYLPSLSDWKDSTGCAINKAELIFQVEKGIKNTIDTSLYSTYVYPYPQKVILSLIADSLGTIYSKQKLIFPTDLLLGQAYYGGYYNKVDGTYRFNLANHLQDIIKGKKRNYGFYLTTDNKNAIFRRLVLKGAKSKVGIRFDVTYTKIK